MEQAEDRNLEKEAAARHIAVLENRLAYLELTATHSKALLELAALSWVLSRSECLMGDDE